jgi:hypothetical protein
MFEYTATQPLIDINVILERLISSFITIKPQQPEKDNIDTQQYAAPSTPVDVASLNKGDSVFFNLW